jgi:hypothetical protein
LSAKRVINKLQNFKDSHGINLTCKFTPDGYKDIDEYLRKGGAANLFFNNKNINLEDVEIHTLW